MNHKDKLKILGITALSTIIITKLSYPISNPPTNTAQKQQKATQENLIAQVGGYNITQESLSKFETTASKARDLIGKPDPMSLFLATSRALELLLNTGFVLQLLQNNHIVISDQQIRQYVTQTVNKTLQKTEEQTKQRLIKENKWNEKTAKEIKKTNEVFLKNMQKDLLNPKYKDDFRAGVGADLLINKYEKEYSSTNAQDKLLEEIKKLKQTNPIVWNNNNYKLIYNLGNILKNPQLQKNKGLLTKQLTAILQTPMKPTNNKNQARAFTIAKYIAVDQLIKANPSSKDASLVKQRTSLMEQLKEKYNVAVQPPKKS